MAGPGSPATGQYSERESQPETDETTPDQGLEARPTSENITPNTLVIRAGELFFDAIKGQVQARDGVSVEWGGQAFSATTGELNLSTRTLHLGGNLEWEAPGFLVEASDANIELGGGGHVGTCHLAFDTTGTHLWAGRLDWSPKGTMSMADVILTPCYCSPDGAGISVEPPDGRHRPLILMSARRAALETVSRTGTLDQVAAQRASFAYRLGWAPGNVRESKQKPASKVLANAPQAVPEKRVQLEDAILRVAGIPVFYLPRVTLALTPGGYSGPLAPRVTHYQDGLDVEFPGTWRIDSRNRLWLGLGWTELRGPRVSGALAYAGASSRGKLGVEYRRDATNDRPPNRGEWSWRHAGRFSNKIGLFADLTGVSDADYIQDFGTDIATRADHQLSSRARVEWPGERWEAVLGLRRYVTAGGGDFGHAGRMPELDLAYTGTRVRLGPGTMRVDGRASTFQQRTGEGTGLGDGFSGPLYANAHLRAAWVAHPLRVISFQTSLGYHGGAMTPMPGETQEDSELGGTIAFRQSVPLTIDVSTRLARVFGTQGPNGGGARHLVIPEVRLYHDIWSRVDPDYAPPIEAPSVPANELVFGLKQHLFAWKHDGAPREIGYARWSVGREVVPGGRLTDVEMAWSVSQPVHTGLTFLVSPDFRALSWLFLDGSAMVGDVSLGYRVGWMNPEREARPPWPYYPPPKLGGWSIDLAAGAGLNRFGAILPGMAPVLTRVRLAFRSSFSVTDRVRSQAQRIEIHYQSRCGCFSLYGFAVFEADRSVPSLGGALIPGGQP